MRGSSSSIQLVVALIGAVCYGQSVTKTVKIVNNGGSGTEPRLGLLATQLGLSPVPGYGEATGGAAPPASLPSQDYLPTGGAPDPPSVATGYSVANGAGLQGGNLVSQTQCQCVPAEHCPSYNGGGAGLPSGQHGGNLPVISEGDGQYSGQQGGNLPVIGGGNNNDGAPYSGSSDGQHGGNLPVIVGGDAGPAPGYDGSAGKPNSDGAGLLDLRIVNRPPTSGGVQCLNGQVFCCDLGKDVPGPVDQVQPGFTGYATCGSRNLIDVPSKQLEYGDAKFGAYPWMAVILGKGNNYVGAGALISPYYVLTAAHKIKSWKPGASMKVRFGEWNAKEDDEPYKNVEIPIDSVLIHDGFNSENLQNDIALVKLAKPIDTANLPHIKAACLPQKGYQYTGQRCWVAGFGKDAFGGGKHSYIMKEVDLPIVDSDLCQQRLRTTRLGNHFELNRPSFLCAGGEEGKDACTGDGGSPLVCDLGKGGWQVVGLVAWGIGCADYGIPGVYVNVPTYVDWINENIYN